MRNLFLFQLCNCAVDHARVTGGSRTRDMGVQRKKRPPSYPFSFLVLFILAVPVSGHVPTELLSYGRFVVVVIVEDSYSIFLEPCFLATSPTPASPTRGLISRPIAPGHTSLSPILLFVTFFLPIPRSINYRCLSSCDSARCLSTSTQRYGPRQPPHLKRPTFFTQYLSLSVAINLIWCWPPMSSRVGRCILK